MKRSVVTLAFGLGLMLSAGTFASSASAASPGDAQLARLVSAKKSLKWNWVPPGKSARYGHAEVLIDAPLATVRAHVTDYAKYREFAPKKFKQSRIVAKRGDTTDVYFRIPILKGLASMSYVLRFGPPAHPAPDTEIIQGKFVSGSTVKDVDLSFTLRQVGPSRTILSADILAVPSFPAPQDAIDEELRDAAMNAVDAVNDQSAGRAAPAAN
jgi:hypothetical protein